APLDAEDAAQQGLERRRAVRRLAGRQLVAAAVRLAGQVEQRRDRLGRVQVVVHRGGEARAGLVREAARGRRTAGALLEQRPGVPQAREPLLRGGQRLL